MVNRLTLFQIKMETSFINPLEQIKVAEDNSDVKEESEEDPLTGRKTQC